MATWSKTLTPAKNWQKIIRRGWFYRWFLNPWFGPAWLKNTTSTNIWNKR